jgi:hypothetical protein
MTTIAYSHKDKQIAFDSRKTLRGVCCDKTNKVHKANSSVFVYCGNISDIGYFADNFAENKEVGLGEVQLEISAIMIEKGEAFYVYVHEGVFNKEPISSDFTLDSGGEFALAALDFGKTAREAVKYAMTRDIYTGGKVKVISLI